METQKRKLLGLLKVFTSSQMISEVITFGDILHATFLPLKSPIKWPFQMVINGARK